MMMIAIDIGVHPSSLSTIDDLTDIPVSEGDGSRAPVGQPFRSPRQKIELAEKIEKQILISPLHSYSSYIVKICLIESLP